MNNGNIIIFGVSIVISGIIAWYWVRGITYMMDNHPDYKGEDFLDEYSPKETKPKQNSK